MAAKTDQIAELSVGDASSAAPVVAAEDLHKVYEMGSIEVPALNGVELRVTSGEFVAVTGPSGSGKSTLLNLIGLIDAPTRGKLFIAGADTAKLSNNERAEFRLRNIGFVFQFFNLSMELTALENVMLPAMLAGKSFARCGALALALLDTVGLSHRAKHRPSQLSGGEQQRIAMARALVNTPAFLLADEPTGNLDSTRAGQIMELLARLNRDSRQTIILVTHEKEFAAIAQRTISLRDGRVQNKVG